MQERGFCEGVGVFCRGGCLISHKRANRTTRVMFRIITIIVNSKHFVRQSCTFVYWDTLPHQLRVSILIHPAPNS